MKPSDFKHIVKESLREAFYNKKVILEGIGKKVSITAWIGEDKPVTYPAVLSKNTIPQEKPYRISWFEDAKTGEPQPQGHIELTQEEVDYILENQQFPLSVYDRIKLSTKHFMMVNPSIHESLLLLENASREIDLWLENRRPI